MLTLPLFLLAGWNAPAQMTMQNPYDASFGGVHARGFPWGAPGVVTAGSFFDVPPARPPAFAGNFTGAGTVSSDALRFPLSGKMQRRLEKIMHAAAAGDHAAAIRALEEVRVKHSSAEPYAVSLLGAEYLETNQWEAAVKSFEDAVRLMPHEAGTHSNLGLSLALVSRYDLAEKELNKSLALDKANEKARTILDAIRVAQRKAAAAAP